MCKRKEKQFEVFKVQSSSGNMTTSNTFEAFLDPDVCSGFLPDVSFRLFQRY